MTTGQQAPRVPGNRPSQRVLVIIPTFNELENLPMIHRRRSRAGAGGPNSALSPAR